MTAYSLRLTLLVNGRAYGRVGTYEEWSENNIRLWQGLPSIINGEVIGTRYKDIEGRNASVQAIANGVALFEGLPAGYVTATVNPEMRPNGWKYHPLCVNQLLGLPEWAYLKIQGDNSLGPWYLVYGGQPRKPWQGWVSVLYMGVTRLDPRHDYIVSDTTIRLNPGKLPRDPAKGEYLTPDEFIICEWQYLPGGGY